MKKFLIGLLALLFTTSAFAEIKIAIIDTNQILQKSPLMITLNNDLIKRFQGRQTELIDAQKKLQDDNNKLNLNAQMSNDERTKLQNTIIADQANVQILTASLQRDLALAKDEALRKFMTKLNEVLTKIARDKKYDLIQQNTGFAFINPNLDITEEVLKEVK